MHVNRKITVLLYKNDIGNILVSDNVELTYPLELKQLMQIKQTNLLTWKFLLRAIVNSLMERMKVRVNLPDLCCLLVSVKPNVSVEITDSLLIYFSFKLVKWLV